MNDDHFEQDSSAPAQVEEYAAPALADLGSFAELTQNNPSGVVLDAEGMS